MRWGGGRQADLQSANIWEQLSKSDSGSQHSFSRLPEYSLH